MTDLDVVRSRINNWEMVEDLDPQVDRLVKDANLLLDRLNWLEDALNREIKYSDLLGDEMKHLKGKVNTLRRAHRPLNHSDTYPGSCVECEEVYPCTTIVTLKEGW